MKALVIFMVLILTLAACGKKGELSPPPGHPKPPESTSAHASF